MSTTEDHKEKKVYEIGYSILPSIPEENLPQVVSKISTVVKEAGASEFDSEAPIKMDLAYAMSKTVGSRKYIVNEAYVGWMKFEAESSAAEIVKTGLERIEEVLRFLLIKAPRESAFTFAEAMKAKAEKEAPQETSDSDHSETSSSADEVQSSDTVAVESVVE